MVREIRTGSPTAQQPNWLLSWWNTDSPWNKVVAQILKILLMVICENIPMEENTVVGAMITRVSKMGRSVSMKTEEASWLVSAKLYCRRIMRDCGQLMAKCESQKAVEVACLQRGSHHPR